MQQGARLYIDQSAGEIPALTGLLVHALVAAPALIERAPEQLQAVVTGLVEARRAAAAQADLTERTLLSLFPERPAEELKAIARIYAAALPESLRPEVAAASRTRQLFPALHREELSRAQIEAVIEPRFAIAAEGSSDNGGLRQVSSSSARIAGPLAAMLAGGAMGWMLRRRRETSR